MLARPALPVIINPISIDPPLSSLFNARQPRRTTVAVQLSDGEADATRSEFDSIRFNYVHQVVATDKVGSDQCTMYSDNF